MDFEAKVIARLDTSQIQGELDKVNGILKHITISHSALANQIQAELDKHKFDIQIGNVNYGNVTSQAQQIANKIENSFSGAINQIDLVNGGIGNMQRMLQGAGFNKNSIAAITQDLRQMSIEVNKITTSMTQNGNIRMNIIGIDELGRAVSITRQYNAETGRIVNTNKSVTQSFQTSAEAAKAQGNSVKNAYNELISLMRQIGNNEIKVAKLDPNNNQQEIDVLLNQIAALRTEYDSLYSTFGSQLSAEQLSGLSNECQNTSAQIDLVKAKLEDTKKLLGEEIQIKLDNGKFESSLNSVLEKYNILEEKSDELKTNMSDLRNAFETLNNPDSSLEEKIAAFEKFESLLPSVKTEVDNLAKAQETLSKSSTLSNNIQAWMEQNTNAAQRYRSELEDLLKQLDKNKDPAVLKDVSLRFGEIKSEAKAAGLTVSSFGDSLKKTILQAAGLASVATVFRKIIRIFKQGIETVIELDDALVDLKKTTTMSDSEISQFYYDANESAKKFGTTTKEIIQSAADWSRLGYSDKASATKMAELSSQFAAISPGLDVSDSTEGLVATMKGFEIETDEVLDGIMSKINAVGNGFALTNSDIISALKVSSASMKAANNDLEQTIALITAGTEITQDASRVGNGLRTISMRIRGMDEETEELDDSLKNIVNDISEFTNGKVSIMLDSNTYKSTYQILKEISGIWDELTDKQQANLLEKLFGKTRANIGAAIIQNFSQAESAMDTMANSAGSAMREMEIIEQSMKFKLNALKETAVGVFQNLFQTDGMGVVIDFLTKLLEGIDAVTSALGLFGTALIGIEIAAFIKNFD